MDAGPLSEREATTVMFTDIVGSTATMALLGDRGWRDVLASHDELTASSSPGSLEQSWTLRTTASSPGSSGHAMPSCVRALSAIR